MNLILILLIIAIIVIIKLNSNKKKTPLNNSNLLTRFKNRFKNRSTIRERLSASFSYSLMADPEININISPWYSEIELREKADIHRSRLAKYGRSKMNGEMLFLGPKGGVYKYNSDGKKKYM